MYLLGQRTCTFHDLTEMANCSSQGWTNLFPTWSIHEIILSLTSLSIFAFIKQIFFLPIVFSYCGANLHLHGGYFESPGCQCGGRTQESEFGGLNARPTVSSSAVWPWACQSPLWSRHVHRHHFSAICISPAAWETWLWVFFRVPCFFVSGIQGLLVPKEPILPSLLSTRTLKCMGKAQCPEVLVRMHVCAHQWTNLQFVHCSLNSDRLSADNRGRTPDRKGFIFSFCKISLRCCFSVSKLCLRPMDCSTLDFPILPYFWSLLKLMSIELVMPSRPLSSCPQSFPALRSFPMSWLFASGGQSIEASAWVPPMNIQGWFPLGID